MGEVVVFQHDPFEDLGLFAEVLDKQHTAYRIVQLFHGEMPEENWEQVKALIVLGGPMSVGDEERFPFLRWEKRIIRAAIDESVPVRRSSGTQVLSTVMPPAEDREDVPPRRRPIRAAPPRAAGPSLWLIAALVLGGAIAAFLILR